MKDEHKSRRDAVVNGGSSAKGAAGTLAIVLFLGAVGVVAYLMLVPEAIDTTGVDTSQTEDMQDREPAAGVETTMMAQPAVQTVEDLPDTQIQTAARPPSEVVVDNDTDDPRIAELQRQLEELRQGQGDDGGLQEALDEMQARLDRERADADARYQTLLAQLGQNTGGNTGMSEDERAARQRLEEERQRRAAIAEAQIMSDGIVLDGGGRTTGGGGGQGGTARGGQADGGGGSGRALSSNEQFIQEASTQSYETVRATRIAALGRTIVQGTTLNAVLETAISTELPGVIRAVVTDDVMSYDGMNVLLPRGTRLIGSYNSDVSVIQDRVQLAWNRAVTPQGVSVELGGYGSDALGMSGQAGKVDTRFRQRFGSAALVSLMGAGPNVVINEDTGGDTADAIQDVGDDMASATQGVVADYLNAGPVIYIDQGTYMTVFVNRDLVL